MQFRLLIALKNETNIQMEIELKKIQKQINVIIYIIYHIPRLDCKFESREDKK